MSLAKRLETVVARELPAEQLMGARDRKFSYRSQTGDWASEAKNAGVVQPVPMHNWLIVFRQADSSKAELFYQEIRRMTGTLGMDIGDPQV